MGDDYSGTAEYKISFSLDKIRRKFDSIALELGEVKNIARVEINGKDAGARTWPPFNFDITSMVLMGQDNIVKIHVTNSLANVTSSHAARTYLEGKGSLNYIERARKFDSGMLPSGLIGPVKICFLREKG